MAGLATSRLGVGGAVSIYTSAQADVVVDVVGYIHPAQGQLFNPVTPSRLYDARPARLAQGQEVTVPVRGVGTVPAGANVTGAVLNLTVNTPSAPGYLTLYPGPCNPAARPLASNLNFVAGQTIANAVVARLGADGSVCVFSQVASEVIVDATGWLGSTGSGFYSVAPQRLVDTRPGESAAARDHQDEGAARGAAGGAGRAQLGHPVGVQCRRAQRHRGGAVCGGLPRGSPCAMRLCPPRT